MASTELPIISPSLLPEHLSDQQRRLIEIGALFEQMQRDLTALVERYVAPYGLSVLAWHALSKIETLGDRATLSAIGERIMASPSTMTGIAARLERAGLVARQASPRDQRAVILTLTDEGRRIQREIFTRFFEDLSRTAEGFEPDRLEDIIHAFRRILDGLHRLLAEKAPGRA